MGDNIFAAVSSDRIKEYICLEIISSGELTSNAAVAISAELSLNYNTVRVQMGGNNTV